MKSGVEKLVFAAILALLVERDLEELHGRNTRDLNRILEGKENTLGGALGRIELKDALAIIEDIALGHFIIAAARQDVGQRRLAGAVRPHDGSNFTGLHGQVQTTDDLGTVFGDAGMEVSDFKHFNLPRVAGLH